MHNIPLRPRRTAVWIVAIAAVVAALVATVGFGQPIAARAAGAPIYNSIPAVYPPSFVSQAYQAQSTREFGGHIVLGGASRFLDTMTIGLNDWACESDYTLTQPGNVWVPALDPLPCVTTPGSSFTHPITFTIYAVDNSGPTPAAGSVLSTVNEIVTVPFRPSADLVNCTGRRWFNAGTATCHNGFAFNVVLDVAALAIELPDEVIVSAAYNTQSYGAAPIGAPGPYNSLNVSVASVAPTVGAQGEVDVMFRDFSGSGFIRESDWLPYLGLVLRLDANATAPASTPPAGPALAPTGFDAVAPATIAAGLLVAGILTLTITRRRVRRS